MNNYFCTIGSDLADKILPAANPLLSGEYEVNIDKAKFNFKIIELKNIRDAFARLEQQRALGSTISLVTFKACFALYRKLSGLPV